MSQEDIFARELLALILEASEKQEPAGGLADDEVLFGDLSRLGLDSLDALQISMAVHKAYGIRIPDSKETRRAMTSLGSFARYLLEKGARPQSLP